MSNEQPTNEELLMQQVGFGAVMVKKYSDACKRSNQEANDADELLRLLRLDPLIYRTEGGSINMPKVQAALKYPDEYPRMSVPEEGEAEQKIAEIQAKAVWGFYEEEHPQYRQGQPTHELESEVTADECNGLVAKIASLESQLGAANKNIAGLERPETQLIEERDHAEDLGTKLANAVSEYFRVPVGEYSSANDPREVALDILDGAYETDSDTDRHIISLKEQCERCQRDLSAADARIAELEQLNAALDAALATANAALAATFEQRT